MSQVQKIMSEVIYNISTIRIVKCLAVHNEEDWVEYNLRNNYDEYDIIRVVEGAVENRPKSTKDGHSTDRTLDIIKNFPDPDNKIELYTLSRPFKSLEEQKQIFVEVARPGDWNIIVDGDEFYMDGDIDRIREAIHIHPMASEFIPTFLHFYRDFWHIRDIDPEWNPCHQRIIRVQPGMRYHTHPVATDVRGVCTCLSDEYQPHRYTIPSLYVYHYGHAKGPEFHKMKKDFYQKELVKFSSDTGGTAADAFDRKFKEFIEYSENSNDVLKFGGQHPTAIKDHPSYSHYDKIYKKWEEDDSKIFKDWKERGFYSEDIIPNIPVWMYGKFQRKAPFYNVVEV